MRALLTLQESPIELSNPGNVVLKKSSYLPHLYIAKALTSSSRVATLHATDESCTECPFLWQDQPALFLLRNHTGPSSRREFAQAAPRCGPTNPNALPGYRSRCCMILGRTPELSRTLGETAAG